MKIEAFGVEIWMNAHENACRHNIAETCVDSITFGDLMALAGKSADILGELSAMKLTYGAIEGSARLRAAIAALYPGQVAEDVLVTHGAAGANALLYEALIEPGDEIVSFTPTYQQHTSIPAAYGARVTQLRLQAGAGYLPDLAELAELVTPKTKLIALTNPNNPTGAVMDEARLRGVAEIAARHGAWVICDEVYRGVNQDDDDLPASIVEIYPRGIAVGGMSKAFALAGLRLGWIVEPPEVRHQVMIHRDYTTISVGIIDELIASIALEHKDALIARNRGIVRANLAIVEAWAATEPLISWLQPAGATVTLLNYALDMTSETFCTRLLEEEGVLLTPGSVFGMEGSVRRGFGNGTETLIAGLAGLSRFLKFVRPGRDR